MATSNASLLPIRFPPEKDELFSSWLVRLAMAHGLKLHVFTTHIFGNRRIWNRDIDKSADTDHIEAVRRHTGTSFNAIFNSTLKSYQGTLYENYNSGGNQTWILPVGIFRQTRNRFGLQMCPICLSEDKEPYYRRLWRISWSTVCTTHNIKLFDICPGCHNPIIFHRGDMGWRNQSVSISMAQCSYCSLYWTSKKVLSSVVKADSDVVVFQKKIEKTLISNWMNVKGFGHIFSLSFFNGFTNLLRVLSVSRRTPNFKQKISNQSNLPLGVIEVNGQPVRSFEYLPIESRYRTIRLASWIFDDLSERFIKTAVHTKTYSSALLPYTVFQSFWYQSLIEQNLTRKGYLITEQEIQAAFDYLKQNKSFIMSGDLKKLMGKNFSECIGDKFAVSLLEQVKKFNEVVENPQRQLVHLAVHYLVNVTDRLFLVNNLAEEKWRSSSSILKSPRALAFLDLPPTIIIPTAAEFENNTVEPLYLQLVAESGESPPKYPETPNVSIEALPEARREYWNWFLENYSASKAMRVIEEAASKHGKIRWIDYRLPISKNGDTLHLHLCPNANYDTGVLAYNFIKRGKKHGLRLVGTLKSEPDMNVLAVYEK